MADNGAVPETKVDPEAGFAENELDDSKAKFINGGLDDTTVVISGGDSRSDASFVGLGKEELKKYAEDPFWVRLRWIMFILFWVGWLAMLVSAIIIIVLAPRCPTRPDLKWYNKDVGYNVYSKSFFDASEDQDGYGDLEGIKQEESYLGDLNANVLWLSSILPTEGDNDRAVTDYKTLDSKFGTVESLKAFCKKLLKLGKQVIMDLVPNQTSKLHEWFVQSRAKEGKYSNYYVWSVGDPNWKRADGSSMWVFDTDRQQFYLSQFKGTADLNLTNEDVIAEFKEILQFWAGVGINGFHINDLEYLTENETLPANDAKMSQSRNFPDNANVVDALRTITDGLDNKPGREKLLFGTVTGTDVDALTMYTGDQDKKGLQMVAIVLEQLTPSVTAQELQGMLEPYVATNDSHWLGWRLTTSLPGSERVFTRLGKDRMIIAHALQALLPGTSLPYYGDEIAMANGVTPMRETVSPMQWTKGKNAGFSEGTPWTPVNSGYITKNLESMTAQLGDDPMMDSFSAINALRTNESLQFGKIEFCSHDNLLVFSRAAPGFPSYLVVANMGAVTAHKFGGDACVGNQPMAELVFTSRSQDHDNTKLKMNEAIIINANEVIVLKLPA